MSAVGQDADRIGAEFCHALASDGCNDDQIISKAGLPAISGVFIAPVVIRECKLTEITDCIIKHSIGMTDCSIYIFAECGRLCL